MPKGNAVLSLLRRSGGVSSVAYQIITTEAELHAAVRRLEKADAIAFDTEFVSNTLTSLSFAWSRLRCRAN